RMVSSPALAPMPMVVGAGRSGTTVLRLMLDMHPQLAIPLETFFLRVLFPTGGPPLTAAQCVERMTSHRRSAAMHVGAEAWRPAVALLAPSPPAEAARCFYRLYAQRFNKPRWGDKTPAYIHEVGALHHLLPETRFIHLIRDGRAVALASRRAWWRQGMTMTQ